MKIFFSGGEAREKKWAKVNYYVSSEPYDLLWGLYKHRFDMSYIRPLLGILGYKILSLEEVKKEEGIER